MQEARSLGHPGVRAAPPGVGTVQADLLGTPGGAIALRAGWPPPSWPPPLSLRSPWPTLPRLWLIGLFLKSLPRAHTSGSKSRLLSCPSDLSPRVPSSSQCPPHLPGSVTSGLAIWGHWLNLSLTSSQPPFLRHVPVSISLAVHKVRFFLNPTGCCNERVPSLPSCLFLSICYS